LPSGSTVKATRTGRDIRFPDLGVERSTARDRSLDKCFEVIGLEAEDHRTRSRRRLLDELEQHDRTGTVGRIDSEHDLVNWIDPDLGLNPIELFEPVDLLVIGRHLVEVVDDELGKGKSGVHGHLLQLEHPDIDPFGSPTCYLPSYSPAGRISG